MHLQYLRHYLALDFAVNEINNNPNILPNITLGYDIYDTCYFNEQAMQATMRALSGGVKHYWNYKCGDNGKTIAFIGHLLLSSSESISQMLSPYEYPQISYGAANFKSKIDFLNIFNAAHGTNVINKAIIELLKYFGWTCIGILTDYEEKFQISSENLKEESSKNGICVEYLFKISFTFSPKSLNVVSKARSKVIVLNTPISMYRVILKHVEQFSKTLIFTINPLSSEYFSNKNYIASFKEALFFTPQTSKIVGLKEVLQKADPTVYPNNKVLQNAWLNIFNCVPPDYKFSTRYWCKKNHTLTSFSNLKYDVDNFQTTYSVYLAVYVVAFALHNMYMANYKTEEHQGSFIQKIHPKQMNMFLRNLYFKTPFGDDIIFGEMGIVNTHLELVQFLMFPNKTYAINRIGEYIPNMNKSAFFIKENYVKWAESMKEVHPSRCVDACPPGFRRSLKGNISCFYECVACSAGEFANETDRDNCMPCPEDEWPDLKNVACLKRPLDFLSFHNPLGTLLTSLIVILYVFSMTVLVIFITYRETPIVRANNRDLSYTILISLMLSFLCSLLFIGYPARLTCLLQNIIFNLVFTVAASSVLAKTITVLIAFNVIKPRSRFRPLLRNEYSHAFVIFCFIGELGICLYWISFYPPYPARDSVSKPGILILYCNVGSHVIFYLALGYNSFFALLCFLVAYFSKKLPDRFNEALHITFSMLVFCSVWISFIPAYVSTKGKYMTAVQVFAILASSTGLLGFIFFPKCFIIIFRAELNIKKSLYSSS
ncbi:vomeronasal type-2 receptor 26-like [Leptodactylus fuscus]